jgi:hypothetical protein
VLESALHALHWLRDTWVPWGLGVGVKVFGDAGGVLVMPCDNIRMR